MSFWSSVSRTAYLISRASGDVNATRRGRLPARMVKRRAHRATIAQLKRWGLW